MADSEPAGSASDRPLSPALDKTFKTGLVLKGLDGILEVAGGILLLFLSPHAIEHRPARRRQRDGRNTDHVGTITWTMRVTDYHGQQATQQFTITILS